MAEIEIGSEWSCDDYVTLKRAIVRAVFRDSDGMEHVTIENVWTDGMLTFTSPQRGVFLEDHELIQPFFKVGKTYGPAYSPLARLRYEVTEVRELDGKKYAIAVRTEGAETQLMVLESFENFREV
jgi:hypothetical protein